MADPTYYCVQTFYREGRRLRPARLHHYPTPRAARQALPRLSGATGAAIAYAVEARPEYGIWGEPRVIGRHGETGDES